MLARTAHTRTITGLCAGCSCDAAGHGLQPHAALTERQQQQQRKLTGPMAKQAGGGVLSLDSLTRNLPSASRFAVQPFGELDTGAWPQSSEEEEDLAVSPSLQGSPTRNFGPSFVGSPSKASIRKSSKDFSFFR